MSLADATATALFCPRTLRSPEPFHVQAHGHLDCLVVTPIAIQATCVLFSYANFKILTQRLDSPFIAYL